MLVTGAAGQIAYSLLYSVAKGDVFGLNQVHFNAGCLELLSQPRRECFANACLFGAILMKPCTIIDYCYRKNLLNFGIDPSESG